MRHDAVRASILAYVRQVAMGIDVDAAAARKDKQVAMAVTLEFAGRLVAALADGIAARRDEVPKVPANEN